MGNNLYSFWILYIDFEIVLITCFEFIVFFYFFSSSHELFEIARIVLDQFNHFWNCYNMQM